MATPGHPYKRGAVLQQSILGGRGSHAIAGVRQKNKKHEIALQPRGNILARSWYIWEIFELIVLSMMSINLLQSIDVYVYSKENN